MHSLMSPGSNTLLITGANGFVGKQLCAELSRQGQAVRAAVRSKTSFVENTETISIGDINIETDWSEALRGITVAVHLAAAMLNAKDSKAYDALHKTNVEGTWNLARQAADAGVKRFIFISSIKVNGEMTPLGLPFSAEDKPLPIDAYGISKLEAEQSLKHLSEQTGMELVIIRPPLVYGPGVKANFRTLMRCLKMGIPLPLASVHNKRSFVAIENLLDLIITCIDHPAAANQTFLAADGEDMSTPELLQRLGVALGKPAKLIPVPIWLLKMAAQLLGKGDMAQRLVNSLQVDIGKTCERLGWQPPVSVEDALKKTAMDFLKK